MLEQTLVSWDNSKKHKIGEEKMSTIEKVEHKISKLKFNAIRWTGNNLKECIDFVGGLHDSVNKITWTEYEALVKNHGLKINMFNRGWVYVNEGDYILKLKSIDVVTLIVSSGDLYKYFFTIE